MADQQLIEGEDIQAAVRNYWVGSRLWIAGLVFYFLAFAFSFLYLRSLNANHMWHPAKVQAPAVWGTAIVAALVVSAIVFTIARTALERNSLSIWRWAALVAFLLALTAAALQIVEYRELGFGPGAGGFASTFVAWTGGVLVVVLGMAYWLETIWATSIRAGTTLADTSRGERRMLAANVEGFGAVWYFVVAVAVATYGLLYWVG